jgi:hypothetical protein
MRETQSPKNLLKIFAVQLCNSYKSQRLYAETSFLLTMEEKTKECDMLVVKRRLI